MRLYTWHYVISLCQIIQKNISKEWKDCFILGWKNKCAPEALLFTIWRYFLSDTLCVCVKVCMFVDAQNTGGNKYVRNASETSSVELEVLSNTKYYKTNFGFVIPSVLLLRWHSLDFLWHYADLSPYKCAVTVISMMFLICFGPKGLQRHMCCSFTKSQTTSRVWIQSIP